MPDMLVKLYTLPDLAPVLAEQAAQGITVRRALAPEKRRVVEWVRKHFHDTAWDSECDVSFAHQPIGCYVAVRDGALIGFGCYDVTAKGFFGPTGVAESARGLGTGKALLLACLHSLRIEGYGYAIIGAAGPTEFYTHIVGATVIEDSWPGVYAGLLD
ncbi:GNAT family N-acetyltransferase [Aggregatilinea lenta]|uniref:GNAT family N-acetyltransferase n=1 Tax=Aggregatilinea lenta TaxID=913108 RepID=UPI000E5B5688|nr:GNAT family N-acetyltransferase [Aggregatilinea lenta]